MKMHMTIEHTTGRTKARGKSGRWYDQREIDRAYAARRGADDPEGAAIADDIDRSDWSDADMVQALQDEMHDCPECKAARAMGEQPTFRRLADVVAMMGVRPKRKRERTIRRWREQKRRR